MQLLLVLQRVCFAPILCIALPNASHRRITYSSSSTASCLATLPLLCLDSCRRPSGGVLLFKSLRWYLVYTAVIRDGAEELRYVRYCCRASASSSSSQRFYDPTLRTATYRTYCNTIRMLLVMLLWCWFCLQTTAAASGVPTCTSCRLYSKREIIRNQYTASLIWYRHPVIICTAAQQKPLRVLHYT